MIPRLPGPPRDQPPPTVLLADDDTRVRELLAFAFKTHHFRVIDVSDGEEALRRARADRPDLIVADVRLPRRGGLELCDVLRREPEHGDVAILLLSTTGDTESRVEALAHGADEFMTKPFSPKELIARAQRLVARARDAARQRQRSVELERDLGRLENEAQRAREEAARERSLRSLAGGMVGELLRTLDLEELDARLLREICRQTGARSAALLAPAGDGTLATVDARGDVLERWAGLSLPERGTCVQWLSVLGRAVRREELERLAEPPRELHALATYGVAMLAALREESGVDAVVVCEDRADGGPFGAPERERLGALCAAASPARATARRFREQQDRALAALSAPASGDARRREAAREAAARLEGAAGALGLSAADRVRLRLALDLGPWAWSDAGRSALASLGAGDPTRRMRQLSELIASAEACASGAPGPEDDVLALLTALGMRYQSSRLAGRSAFESWRTAVTWLGIHADPQLRATFPEAIEPVH